MTPSNPQLWQPSAEFNRESNFARYLQWLERERGLYFSGYHDMWEWSSTEIEAFWRSLWDFFEIKASRPYDIVLADRGMPGAKWFPGARLNYTEHVFRNLRDGPAILYASEQQPLDMISWGDLQKQVAAVAASLRAMGVSPGDRVAAYLPNIPHAVIAFLACASLGAIWSSCSPDFGTQGVVERFQQIEPRVLIAVAGYTYGGKFIDRRGEIAAIRDALPTLEHTVVIPHLHAQSDLPKTIAWETLLEIDAPLQFEQVPFDHPLWVLYSSGTTGLPKAIVQGQGGILLEHLKALALQNDLKPGDRFFWFTTTGWMMWNLLVGGLLSGGTLVLYDGNPLFPGNDVLWQLAQDARITRFGASAGFFTTCMKSELRPIDRFDLSSVRIIGSTGSPLPPEAFRWVYDSVKHDVWLAPTSGGTDICTSLVGACPFLPVYEGEMQGPQLGVRAHAFNDEGRIVLDQVGELVITAPMPTMPLYFWNDPTGNRYRESYFAVYPGVWRHGDWVNFRSNGGVVISGRSDSTLNRLGVRIGTSEIYRAIEAIPEISDSLVIGLERPGGSYYMPLFVVLRDGMQLDDVLRNRIAHQIRSSFSPRHVPDQIIQAPAIPRTLNGKKLEVPIKRILLGQQPERVVNPGSLGNPESVDFFVALAQRAQ
ncbi:MAG: acetoacetate--CoA ligase [Gemmatimonadota bacterium]